MATKSVQCSGCALVAAVMMACLCITPALAGKCMFVDGDCKPNPAALPAGAKGAASSWRSLLEGFQVCAKSGSACSGSCTTVPGKGCTLTPAARKASLGPLAPTFGACASTPAAQCAANPNCKAGAGGTCVIAATGIINTFELQKNYPAAIGVLTGCKALVANPAACNAA